MFNFSASPPLSLYIHFPWCVKKCPYCDFNSHSLRGSDPGSVPGSEYVATLLRDLESELPRIWGRNVDTIFMGGGTPSLFAPEDLDRLLSSLRALLNIKPDTEITLEANPGTVDQSRFQEYRNLGINRLSLGIQSFNNQNLTSLGRIHDGGDARKAIEAANQAGFQNLNLDLMFGLPAQGIEQALHDLDVALSYNPSHLSHYQLTIEPNTLFHHSPPTLPGDDASYAMQEECHAVLNQRGYTHYEVSAFSRPGMQCRHNLNYWKFGDYLGLGAGAHGKITHVPDQTIQRYWKQKQPEKYMRTAGSEECIGDKRNLNRHDAGFEFFLNALRLIEGFSASLFQQNTGLPLAQFSETIANAESNGWLERDMQMIKPTETGQKFLNDLVELFLPEPHHAT